jgi:hypothetical protein
MLEVGGFQKPEGRLKWSGCESGEIKIFPKSPCRAPLFAIYLFAQMMPRKEICHFSVIVSSACGA